MFDGLGVPPRMYWADTRSSRASRPFLGRRLSPRLLRDVELWGFLLRRTMHRATGVEEMTNVLRLEVLMGFKVNARGSYRGEDGIAAVRWQPLTQAAALTKDRARITLAALHYGRILAVHRKFRQELFHRVSLAARGLADGAPETQFDTWPVHIGDANFDIAPWHTVQQDHWKLKTCTSTLKIHDRGRLSV